MTPASHFLTDRTTGQSVPCSIVTDRRILTEAMARPGWYFDVTDWLMDLADFYRNLFIYGIQIPEGVVAVGAVTRTYSGKLHIHRLDTIEEYRERLRGLGSLMVAVAGLYALRRTEKKILSLYAIRSAMPFYSKLGFVEDVDRDNLRPDEGAWMKLDEPGIEHLLHPHLEVSLPDAQV